MQLIAKLQLYNFLWIYMFLLRLLLWHFQQFFPPERSTWLISGGTSIHKFKQLHLYCMIYYGIQIYETKYSNMWLYLTNITTFLFVPSLRTQKQFYVQHTDFITIWRKSLGKSGIVMHNVFIRFVMKLMGVHSCNANLSLD